MAWVCLPAHHDSPDLPLACGDKDTLSEKPILDLLPAFVLPGSHFNDFILPDHEQAHPALLVQIHLTLRCEAPDIPCPSREPHDCVRLHCPPILASGVRGSSIEHRASHDRTVLLLHFSKRSVAFGHHCACDILRRSHFSD